MFSRPNFPNRSATVALSHARTIRAAAAFGCDPYDVLGRILDIAGLAVDAVLRIDLQALGTVVAGNEFVDRGRAVTGLRSRVPGQVHLHRDGGILQGQV